MIGRVWHGWTSPENADPYETLLKSEIFPGIFAKGVEGLRRIELFRSNLGGEVEFMTIIWFASWEAVEAFAGEDHATAYVPASACALRPVSTSADSTSQSVRVKDQMGPKSDAGSFH